jgi:hypothetical protein
MNPNRSGFLQALAESLKVLNHIGDPLPRTVATRYPEVARSIESPSSPVVLELRGISRGRLLSERGSRDVDAVGSFNEMQAYPEVNFTTAYQILDVTPADIIAVHDLCDRPTEEDRDSSWRPDPSRVDEARQPCRNGLLKKRDWLAVDSCGSKVSLFGSSSFLRRQRSHVRIVSGAPLSSTIWSFQPFYRFWAGKHRVSC